MTPVVVRAEVMPVTVPVSNTAQKSAVAPVDITTSYNTLDPGIDTLETVVEYASVAEAFAPRAAATASLLPTPNATKARTTRISFFMSSPLSRARDPNRMVVPKDRHTSQVRTRIL